MIDPDLVTRKMALISADLRALAPFAGKTREAYLASETDEVIVERYLERIIGRMIDVNFHLITETGNAPPHDYFESFTRLGKLGVLPPDFAVQIAASAGLRNRIVHEYDAIDPERVYEGLQAAVRDIPRYLRSVAEFVKSSSARS